MFYPDVKQHISPSAFASWHNSRASFIKSYFLNDYSDPTASMKAGEKIHGLIEAGFWKPRLKFDSVEEELKIEFENTGVYVLGRPDTDGFKIEDGEKVAIFADYKTGGDVAWTREKLREDWKMRLTAWLVWNKYGMPTTVRGYIEWIGTEYKDKEIVPTPDESMTVKVEYSDLEMRAMSEMIRSTIEQVNVAYEAFLAKPEGVELDNEDCQEYMELYRDIQMIEEMQIAPKKARMKEIEEGIAEKMAMGEETSVPLDFGTFYFRATKTYSYPENMNVIMDNGVIVSLEYANRVASATKVAKKHYEAANEPDTQKLSLQFRAKK